MSRPASLIAAITAAALAFAVPAVAFEPASAAVLDDQLAVSVVGDGTSTGNVAVPVSIELLTGTGEVQGAIALPTVASGSQLPFTLGADRDQQGALQQSVDHSSVVIGGYAAVPSAIALNDTAAPATPRVIAKIDANGVVDTSTTLADGYSVRHIRGVATVDGSQYWTGGHGGDAPTTKGGVLTVAAGGSAPVAIVSGTSNLNNGRVVGIHDGELYLTSDRSGFEGLNKVGAGIPTTASTLTRVAAAPSGMSIAHDFAFIGDFLYIGFTEGAQAGIAKYAQVNGAWAFVGSAAGSFWGITGRVAGDDVLLYAVRGSTQGNELVRIIDSGDDTSFTSSVELLATASSGTAFRGVAFAPGFEPGTGDPVTIGAKPTVAWDVRVAGGVGNALSAVLGGSANPVARGTIADPEGSSFTAVATSSDQGVVADAAITLSVSENGTFTLAPTPSGVGAATITIEVTTDDERTATSTLAYRVSAAMPVGVTTQVGMSDASAAIDAGDGYFFVADDDSNAIRLFSPVGGEAVAEFDFSDHISFERAGEAHDFEAVARAGDTVYWIGSLGNTRSGNIRLDRNIILATAISGSGASAKLDFVGYNKTLRQALVTWDATDAHGLGADHFGFVAATQSGVSAEGPNSLNVEGASMAPDGTTLWLGFRSPIVGGDALIVPIPEIADVIEGTTALPGDAIQLDLGGRAIRDLARTDDGNYLISAGSADDAGRFALYGWTGSLDTAPVPATDAALGLAGWPGSYEAILGATSLADGTVVRLLLDSGTVDIYGDSTEAQDLAAVEFKKFPAQPVTLSFGAVFTPKSVTVSTNEITAGQSLEVSGTGFAAGESVVVTLYSQPQRLATAIANGNGQVSLRVSIPLDTPAGAHEIEVAGASGEARVALRILAAANIRPASQLGATGAELPTGVIALGVLLLLGGAGVLAARRRTMVR